MHELGDLTEQTFVVTGVPDEKKGERLVVLYQNIEAEVIEAIKEKLITNDLPNNWKPRSNLFFKVDTLPYLGTGKLDLKQIKMVQRM